jgi:hypothetical protein
MDNVDIVKDALATADLKAGNGGYLNTEQSNKFLRGIIDQPTIIKAARSVIIDGENKKIEKIGFGSRIMRPATENTALTSDKYAKPTFGKVELSTKEVIAEVRLSYDTLEANIERGQLKNTIIAMIQERVALDLEELILQGNTASTDPYLAVIDGVLKKANSHVVDLKGAEVDLTAWTNLIKSVPSKYLRDQNAYRIWTSRNIDLAWKNQIASRNTVAGDRFLLENANATALGYQIQPIAMIPEDLTYLGADGLEGGTAENADVANLGLALLGHPQNIVVGFTRQVQMEQDKDITKRQHIIVVTMKVDVAVEETDAMGKLINIKPSYTPA